LFVISSLINKKSPGVWRDSGFRKRGGVMGGKPSSVGFPGITMKREPIYRIFEKLTLVKRKKENFAKI
jgi:hypothetical protein